MAPELARLGARPGLGVVAVLSLPRPGSERWTEAHSEGATAHAMYVSELLDAAGVDPAPPTSRNALEAVHRRLVSLRRADHPDGLVPLDPGSWEIP